MQAAVGIEMKDILEPGSGTELLALVELSIPGPEPADVVEQSTCHALSLHGCSFRTDEVSCGDPRRDCGRDELLDRLQRREGEGEAGPA